MVLGNIMTSNSQWHDRHTFVQRPAKEYEPNLFLPVAKMVTYPHHHPHHNLPGSRLCKMFRWGPPRLTNLVPGKHAMYTPVNMKHPSRSARTTALTAAPLSRSVVVCFQIFLIEESLFYTLLSLSKLLAFLMKGPFLPCSVALAVMALRHGWSRFESYLQQYEVIMSILNLTTPQ